MNEKLLDLVNAHAGDWPVVDAVAKFFASDGIYLVGLAAVIFGLLELRSNRRRGIRVGLAAVVGLGLAAVLVYAAGSAVTEARPFVHDPDTSLLIKHGADNSFPSDHATVAAAAAVVAALAWRRWAWLFLVLAAGVAIARVYVGVHYPGDVAAGFAIGSAGAVAGWLATAKVLEWRALPAEQPAGQGLP